MTRHLNVLKLAQITNFTKKWVLHHVTGGRGGGGGTKFTEYIRTNCIWHEVYTVKIRPYHPFLHALASMELSQLIPFYKINSKCPHFVELAWKLSKCNQVNPCFNYLEKCKFCSQDVWKYNLMRHYSQVHQDVELPAIWTKTLDTRTVLMYIFLFCYVYGLLFKENACIP